ncbi:MULTISPECIES: hypothetical protein [Streptomyces]|uniref:hypothetical protein n=1 Tax=Streptomyces TaxID=1883 RepID=UPI00224900A0|nr:hypothetical protein [Streptomyces sp. JHD 1]MCX2969886.1 hypothetical protein [Streptomyces sp. JHD 1]
MEFAAAVGALLLLLFVTLGVIATTKAVRAVGRGMERASAEVRRTVDTTALRARSARFGPVGELARTRLELRTSIDSTRKELAAARTGDASLEEAIGLLDRLHEHARVLDREMGALMDHEPDRARVAARLPELRERTAEIRHSADSLRFAAQDRARRHHADELDGLREQIALESGALRHWDPPQGAPTDGAPGVPPGGPVGGLAGGPAGGPVAAPGPGHGPVPGAAHGSGPGQPGGGLRPPRPGEGLGLRKDAPPHNAT